MSSANAHSPSPPRPGRPGSRPGGPYIDPAVEHHHCRTAKCSGFGLWRNHGWNECNVRNNSLLERSGWKKAMTLVELLVAMLVGLIVFSVVIMVYFSSVNNHVRQEQILEQMQNLRVGLHSMAVDARMAGSGFDLLGSGALNRVQFYDEKAGAWFKYENDSDYGAWPVYGRDGEADGADSVTFCWLAPEFGAPIATLLETLDSGTTVLRTRPGISGDLEDNKDIVFNQGDKWAVVNPEGAVIIVEYDGDKGNDSPNFSIKALPTLPVSSDFPDFPVGSRIYNVRTVRLVTYFIEDGNLMANLHGQDYGDADAAGAVVEAPGFEDLQVVYFTRGTDTNLWTAGLSDPSTVINDPTNNPIWALQLSAVHRAPDRDPYNSAHKPEQLYNHTVVGTAADGHPRRILSETISLRNRIQ